MRCCKYGVVLMMVKWLYLSVMMVDVGEILLVWCCVNDGRCRRGTVSLLLC